MLMALSLQDDYEADQGQMTAMEVEPLATRASLSSSGGMNPISSRRYTDSRVQR